jgi:gliding motility-associated-like protein
MNIKCTFKLLLLFLIVELSIGINTFGQITVNSNLTPQQIVQNYLLGGGVIVSNVTYTGGDSCRGIFQGTSNLGMTGGLILATGKILNAIGPNNYPNIASDEVGTPGDSDLNAIVSDVTYDAAVLEFDFIPASDTISFNFVFASEEYPDFVGSYNDVFAFFLTGQNPAGGNYNKKNIALIPGTTIPVTINNINNGTSNTGPCVNCTYYVNNIGGTTIEYNGFTTVLKAVASVIKCTKYHIKIAIADVGDDAYDSGVFLEAKSFSAPSINISSSCTNGSVPSDSLMAEGCGKGTYTFIRSGNNSQPYTLHYIIGGTATNGMDYQDNSGHAIADSIVFPAGVDTVSITINAIQDGIPEPTETVILNVPQAYSCSTDTVKATIYIKNVNPLQVDLTGDSIICSKLNEQATLNAKISGGFGPYVYSWTPVSGSTSKDSIISVSPAQTTTYTVSVTDSCGMASKSSSFTVQVLCPIEIPNVITPNGDNYNDVFFIKNLEEYSNSKLVIFNRWGKIIYENTNYQNDWGGTKHSDGTYFYILNLNNGKSYHGTLTIL